MAINIALPGLYWNPSALAGRLKLVQCNCYMSSLSGHGTYNVLYTITSNRHTKSFPILQDDHTLRSRLLLVKLHPALKTVFKHRLQFLLEVEEVLAQLYYVLPLSVLFVIE